MKNWLRTRTEELVVVELPTRPVRRDITMVVALLIIAAIELMFRHGGLEVAAFVAAAIAAVALWWRRTHGFYIAVAIAAAEFIIVVLIGFDDPDATTFFATALATIIAVYSMARWAPLVRVAIGAVLVWTFEFVGFVRDDERVLGLLLSPLPVLAVVAIGLVFRYRAALRRGAEAQIRLTERNVLARELHDTIAHHVSAIAVQAQAAQFVLDTDPEQARHAIAAIERTATEAIDEMRRMVGVLRSDDDHARTVTADQLAELADLSGTPTVTVDGHTDLSVLPAGVAAAAYRIVQESITNARRHSRDVTSIAVAATLTADSYTVEIVNDGTPSTRSSGSGYGLVGMQERVDALGGSLDVGPSDVAGWHVCAHIPLRRGGDT